MFFPSVLLSSTKFIVFGLSEELSSLGRIIKPRCYYTLRHFPLPLAHQAHDYTFLSLPLGSSPTEDATLIPKYSKWQDTSSPPSTKAYFLSSLFFLLSSSSFSIGGPKEWRTALLLPEQLWNSEPVSSREQPALPRGRSSSLGAGLRISTWTLQQLGHSFRVNHRGCRPVQCSYSNNAGKVPEQESNSTSKYRERGASLEGKWNPVSDQQHCDMKKAPSLPAAHVHQKLGSALGCFWFNTASF